MRRILNFHRDHDGWSAELACGHQPHVRRGENRWVPAWIDSANGRAAHIGTLMDCPHCTAVCTLH